MRVGAIILNKNKFLQFEICPEAGLLNKSSRLAAALGVTKF
jgi:hypothetical protein